MASFKTKWRRSAVAAGVLAAALALAGCATNNNGENTLHPKGTEARRILSLFTPIFWVAVFVGVCVLTATLVFAIKFRERPGNTNPKQIHGSTPLEIGWTIVPALILVVIAVFTIKTIFQMDRTLKNPIEVQAVGKQWWWQFNTKTDPYKVTAADGTQTTATEIVTANEVHIPVGKNVQINAQACDKVIDAKGKQTGLTNCNVIHSFWVPELNGKADAVPGRDHLWIIEADKAGTYLGECAEYCGLSHANMHFRVIAESPDDYAKWVKQQQKGPAQALLTADNKPAGNVQNLIVNKFGCVGCHVLTDPSKYAFAPNLTHLASRTTFASGYFDLYARDKAGNPIYSQPNTQKLADWIYNAPGLLPMESKDCRLPPGPNAPCAGMPSFSQNTPKGQATMTKDEAMQIAQYLLDQK